MSEISPMLDALLNCKHEITSERVILYEDERKKGNALFQVDARLQEVAEDLQREAKNEGINAMYSKLLEIMKPHFPERMQEGS